MDDPSPPGVDAQQGGSAGHVFQDQTASPDSLVEPQQNSASAIDDNLIHDYAYRLYEKLEGERTFPRDPEPSESTRFWRDRSSFESATFAANTTELTTFHWLPAGVLFYAELVAVIVLAIISWSKRKQSLWNGPFSSPIRQVEGLLVFEAVVAVGGYFAILFLKEVYFLKFSLLYVILVAILGLILALSCSVWGSIGFVLVIIIVGLSKCVFFL
jgi:hypothetical protein